MRSSTPYSGIISHNNNASFHENLVPALILETSLMAGVSVPETIKYVAPMVKVQGKKVKALVFEILKDVKKSLRKNLTKKATRLNSQTNTPAPNRNVSPSNDVRRAKSVTLNRAGKKLHNMTSSSSSSRVRSEDLELDMVDSYADLNIPSLRQPSLTSTRSQPSSKGRSMYVLPQKMLSFNGHPSLVKPNLDHMVSSMPDLPVGVKTPYERDYATSIRNSFELYDNSEIEKQDDDQINPIASLPPSHFLFTKAQKVKMLKSNYFNNTTQFVIALQNISLRLSKLPRDARLSALKAELSVLNKDLPCAVDVPMLLPKSKKGKYHKICHITINESAVLNSAEHVPYLLLIEYFSNDLDFNPDTSDNIKILKDLQDKKDDGKYMFDISYNTAPKNVVAQSPTSTKKAELSVSMLRDNEGSDLGDVSVVKLTNTIQQKNALMFPTKSFFSEDTGLHDQLESIENSLNTHLKGSSEHDKNLALQLRIAGVMLRQLEDSSTTLPLSQAHKIKSNIIKSMNAIQNSFEDSNADEKDNGAAGSRKLSNDLKVAGLSYLGEDWQKKKERIRKQSKYGKHENWDLYSMIAKTGDDLAQEAFASQLIQIIANIWYADGVRVWVKRMRMLITSSDTGLVETITNAFSVHSIKKSLTEHMVSNNELQAGQVATLKDHFVRMFGKESSAKYKIAQQNFCSSLAAYSIICYLLQIKDRHNGNIMIDSEGHIIHIDFGFLLSNSPGSVGFESAPFKLTQDYVDVLGGLDSYYFKQYVKLTKDAFRSIRRHSDSLVHIVELMQTDSSLPCFRAGESTSVQLQQRLQLHLTDEEADSFTENFLVAKSLNSAYTKLYDQFQMLTQGIYM